MIKPEYIACNFLNRIICLHKPHTNRRKDKCSKGCGYYCELCCSYSYFLSYAYSCSHCRQTYCLPHFIMHNCNLIHYWQNSRITLYDSKTRTKKTLEFNTTFNTYSESIAIESAIFITGGFTPLSNEVIKVDIIKKTTANMSPMLSKKIGHSLCNIQQYIYSIGGYNNVSIRDCEMYCIQKNKWIALPSLLKERAFSAMFSFDNKFLYYYGGYVNISAHEDNSMEMLDIVKKDLWKEVKIQNAPSPTHGMHGMQISPLRAVIFGWYPARDDSYIVSIRNDEAKFEKNSKGLAIAANFNYTTAPVNDGKFIYAIDQIKNIHIFNINELVWDVCKIS